MKICEHVLTKERRVEAIDDLMSLFPQKLLMLVVKFHVFMRRVGISVAYFEVVNLDLQRPFTNSLIKSLTLDRVYGFV